MTTHAMQKHKVRVGTFMFPREKVLLITIDSIQNDSNAVAIFDLVHR